MFVFLQDNINQTLLLASGSKTHLPAHVLKELATKSETVTPWWWGLRTLIKVQPMLQLLLLNLKMKVKMFAVYQTLQSESIRSGRLPGARLAPHKACSSLLVQYGAQIHSLMEKLLPACAWQCCMYWSGLCAATTTGSDSGFSMAPRLRHC